MPAPLLPAGPARPPTDPRRLVRATALTAVAGSVLCAASCVALAVLGALLQQLPLMHELASMADTYGWPGGVSWLLTHPAQASLWCAALSLLPALPSWGLYRFRRWGLWTFLLALAVFSLLNLLAAVWVDLQLARLLHLLDVRADAGVGQSRYRLDRLLTGASLYGGALLFTALQIGMTWRLLRADVRTLFR